MGEQILNKIEKDKLLHFAAGVVIYAIGAVFIGYYAVLCVAAAAVGKEVYDYYYGGTVDAYDAIATVFGGVVCML